MPQILKLLQVYLKENTPQHSKSHANSTCYNCHAFVSKKNNALYCSSYFPYFCSFHYKYFHATFYLLINLSSTFKDNWLLCQTSLNTGANTIYAQFCPAVTCLVLHQYNLPSCTLMSTLVGQRKRSEKITMYKIDRDEFLYLPYWKQEL